MRRDLLPRVSVLTAAYHAAHYIDALIDSIHTQNYPNIEHIVVDDGSADEGATFAALQQYPYIRSFQRINNGQYAAMNECLHMASGEFVCFINQDDLMLPGAIRSVMDYFRSRPETDAVSGRISYVDEQGSSIKKSHPFWGLPLWTYPYTSNIYHGALYIRREFLEKHQIYFDPGLHYAGDYDWILRLLKAGISIGRVDTVLLKFRLHENQTSEKNFQIMRSEVFDIAKRHRLFLPLISLTRKIFFLAGLWDIWMSGGYLAMIKYLKVRLIRNRDR